MDSKGWLWELGEHVGQPLTGVCVASLQPYPAGEENHVCATADEGEIVFLARPPAIGLPGFLHAMEMELAYLNALVGFDDMPPPRYAQALSPRVATMLSGFIDASRLLLVVGHGPWGTAALRNYDNLRVDQLDEVINHITGLLKGQWGNAHRSFH